VFARKHFLSEQTLDMLVDMRWQFACMLADIKLIGGNPRGSKGRDWMDDGKQTFNAHANKQAVVKLLYRESNCCHVWYRRFFAEDAGVDHV
jgi:hypothetical protein